LSEYKHSQKEEGYSEDNSKTKLQVLVAEGNVSTCCSDIGEVVALI
jgi:hypothetical protein